MGQSCPQQSLIKKMHQRLDTGHQLRFPHPKGLQFVSSFHQTSQDILLLPEPQEWKGSQLVRTVSHLLSGFLPPTMLLLESFSLLLALALPCFQIAGWCSALWWELPDDSAMVPIFTSFWVSCCHVGDHFGFITVWADILACYCDSLLVFYLSIILLNFWKYIRTCVVFHTLQFPPRSSFLSKQKHTIMGEGMHAPQLCLPLLPVGPESCVDAFCLPDKLWALSLCLCHCICVECVFLAILSVVHYVFRRA